jgi:DNA polymerase III delta subunit
MLYLFWGNDRSAAVKKSQETVALLLKKKPDASVFKMGTENWDAASFEEYINAQGLFEQKHIVIADGLLADKNAQAFIRSSLEAIIDSPHVFIVIETALDAKTKAALEKKGIKEKVHIKEYALAEGRAKAQDFNIFALADALSKKDKKNLWVLYQKARRAGLEPEQIHGTLFWQMKSIAAAHITKTAAESGLSPFVWSKAVAAKAYFSQEEIARLAKRLVEIYHDAHRGAEGLDSALEQFILSL